MGEQEFYSQTKYTSTKENIAFGLSISCICLLTVIFFGQFNDFLLRLSEAAALAAAITALNIHLLNKLPASYSFKNLPQRVVAHSAIVFTLGALASVITAYMAAGLMGLSFYEVLKFTLATAFMAGLINAAFSLLYFIRLWHKNILHTEELKREIMHTQLESIRHQLSPHFFFNSLNSLNLVIEENPAEAIKYVQHIAHMYRYLLQSKETKVVPLHHELKFAESYIYLQKMRFGKALDMSVIIDKPDMQTVIPPLTLYILLENALKHNIITKSRPLQINVFIRDGKLQISNNVQARSMPEEKPIIGLKTVRSSYESICVQPMQIIQDDDNFTVSLPLIKELSQSA